MTMLITCASNKRSGPLEQGVAVSLRALTDVPAGAGVEFTPGDNAPT